MAGLPQISGQFGVGTEVELRFTPGGRAIAEFMAVAVDRKRDGDKWVDGDKSWFRVTVFGQLAEHFANSDPKKGDKVSITGTVRVEEWESNGQKNKAVKIVADSIGFVPVFAPVRVERTERTQGGGGEDRWQGPPPAGGSGWGS